MGNNNLQEVIAEIKDAVSIESLIEEDGVELQPQGKELVGFHSNKHDSESKTSLHANPAKGVYYCFNCDEGGDHFTWLEKNRNMTFHEALVSLADKANVTISNVDKSEMEKHKNRRIVREKLYKLYTKVAEVYHNNLSEQEYRLLKDEWGLTEETVKKYKIGFAPVGGKFIMQEMLKHGFHEGLINISGLINKGGYDLFQGRLVFPYWKNNQAVYFIARLTDKTPDTAWEKSKYKKLPTTTDNKQDHMENLVANEYFVGEDSLWGAEEVIITEGVTDCYTALQNGIACISPATVGFRQDDHNKLLALTKNIKNVYICNDNESSQAGEKGAIKTAEFLESNNVNVKIINLPLPAGKSKIDLAEYLRDNGIDSFTEQMKEAKSLIEVDLELLRDDMNNKDLLNAILKRIASIESEIERENWMKKVKAITGIGVKAIRSEVKKISKKTKAQSEAEHKEEPKRLVDQLIKITKDKADLFHDEFKEGFAILQMEDYRKTVKLNSKDFRNWLIMQYLDLTGRSPNTDAISQAINTLNAITIYEGKKNNLYLRVAKWCDLFWYDLADDKWQAVKLSPYGWLVSDRPPAIFRRYANTESQVTPEKTDNHSLELLDKYFNLQNKEDYVLMYACVASYLVPEIPHPIIIFYGDKGSAKSTAHRVIRKIVDPAIVELKILPKKSEDLLIQLMKNYAPCFDNIDRLKSYQSDILCQAVTGAGSSKRELFTSMDEIILKFKKCIMLNGINLVSERDDLLDRSIIIRLERISKDKRKEEAEFWKEFEEDMPFILGSLFNIVSKAMDIYPTVKLDDLPRMADFARWGYALTEAMGKPGKDFLNIYYENIAKANEEAVLDNMVSGAVLELMETNESWKGTATELFEKLSKLDSVHENDKKWTKNSQTLSKELNKMSSALADQGIEIKRSRVGSNRVIELIKKSNKETL